MSNRNDIGGHAIDKGLMLRLFWRISAYYAVLAITFTLLLTIFPKLIGDMPLGGLNEFRPTADRHIDGLQDIIRNSNNVGAEQGLEAQNPLANSLHVDWLRDALSLFYAMLSTLLLMLPVSWVYKSIHNDTVHDHSLDETALVLPAVVAGIVTVVQHSLALAFSLAGIVAGVRFRRTLSDTFDTLFILTAIGVGIAAGIHSIEVAVVLTVFFNYTTIAVCTFGDGLESQHLERKKRQRKQEKIRSAAIRQGSEDT